MRNRSTSAFYAVLLVAIAGVLAPHLSAPKSPEPGTSSSSNSTPSTPEAETTSQASLAERVGNMLSQVCGSADAKALVADDEPSLEPAATEQATLDVRFLRRLALM